MTEKEYIERAALLAEYDRVHVGPPGGARKLIEEAPAADVVEVVHGTWVWTEEGEADYDKYWVCPICGEKSYIHHNYCPNCGAKMDGKVTQE